MRATARRVTITRCAFILRASVISFTLYDFGFRHHCFMPFYEAPRCAVDFVALSPPMPA